MTRRGRVILHAGPAQIRARSRAASERLAWRRFHARQYAPDDNQLQRTLPTRSRRARQARAGSRSIAATAANMQRQQPGAADRCEHPATNAKIAEIRSDRERLRALVRRSSCDISNFEYKHATWHGSIVWGRLRHAKCHEDRHRRSVGPDMERLRSTGLPLALVRARECVMAHFRNLLRRYDLTEPQWRVLKAMDENQHRSSFPNCRARRRC